MKKCSNCGAECSDNLMYCDKCGAMLTATESQNAGFSSTAAVQVDEKSNVMVILLLWLFFPVGLYMMWKYKKSWSQKVKIAITAIFGLFIIIAATSSQSSTTTTTTTTSTSADHSSSESNFHEQDKSISSEEYSITEKETEEPTIDDATIERQYKNKCSEVAYESIVRNANGFEGEYFTFTGEIVQDIGDGAYALGVTFDEYGYYEDRIIFTFDTGDGMRLLEGDTVQIWGISEGIVDTESVMGANISIPYIAAEYVDLYY